MNNSTLINLLHTEPKNDKEVGFNSGLILVLKIMNQPTKEAGSIEEAKLHEATGATIFNKLSEQQVQDIIAAKKNDNKLMAVKILKEATDIFLKEGKEIMDKFFGE